MSRKVEPTDKQRAFVKAKLDNPGISNYQAAIKANYSPNTATHATEDILEKPSVQKLIAKLANDDTLALKLNDGLDAYRVDITGDHSPDFKTRLGYIQEMLGLKGYKQNINLQQFNAGGDISLEFTK